MTTAKRTTSTKPITKSEVTKPSKTYVDLSKLRKASLRRYKKHFNLEVKADSKTELLEAVGRHFAEMPVSETEVAIAFLNYARSNRGKRAMQPDSSLETLATNGATVQNIQR